MQSKGEAAGYPSTDISLDCWDQSGFFNVMPSYCFLKKQRSQALEVWLRPPGASGLDSLQVLLLSVPLQPLAHDVELGVGRGSVGLFDFGDARAVPRVACFSRALLQAAEGKMLKLRG